MPRLALLLIALASPLSFAACGSSDGGKIPAAGAVSDTRSEEAREVDDGMAKHAAKFGNK